MGYGALRSPGIAPPAERLQGWGISERAPSGRWTEVTVGRTTNNGYTSEMGFRKKPSAEILLLGLPKE